MFLIASVPGHCLSFTFFHIICPAELHLNKENSCDTEAPFLDLNLSIINGIFSIIIYDFLFLDGDVLWRPYYGGHKSKLICFARASSGLFG